MEKRIAIDTYVFIDLLSGEIKAERVRPIINDIAEGKVHGIFSSAGLAELYYHLNRLYDDKIASERIVYIRGIPNLTIVPVNEEISLLAGKLRAKYYKKSKREISYIDCMHFATAILTKCSEIITGDKDFLGITEVNVKII